MALPTFTADESARMLKAALALADAGLAVFPLTPHEKHPLEGSHGFRDATTDAHTIEHWWRAAWEQAEAVPNIGVACGQVSGGVVAIDIDAHEGGVDGSDALWEWEREHGELPETVTAATGSGGTHLLYRMDGPCPPSTNGELGIDIRGDGSYIVAPPSVHPNGQAYVWEYDLGERQIADADANVRAFIAHVRPSDFGESKAFMPPEHVGKGERNSTIFRYASSMWAKSMSMSVIMAAMKAYNRESCDPPMPEHEVEQAVRSACKKPAGYSDEVRKSIAAKGERMGHDGGKVPLDKDMRGNVRQTISNATAVYEHDPLLAGRWRYSDFRRTRTVELPLPWDAGEGVREVRDEDYIEATAYMEREYRITKKQAVIDAAQAVCMRNRYDEVRDWLDSLTWDGIPRIQTMLTVWLGAEPNDYTAAVMRTWMLGAVGRAYQPGIKFELMPVLMGPQGIGKSTLAKLLAHNQDWFDDRLNDLNGDSTVEKLRGKWVIEIGELLAMRRTQDVNAVKSFISTQADTIRPKYARETQTWPRRCVFVGTTNDPEFLTDRTGNRRFAPVMCGVREPMADILTDTPERREWFEQAWAEAVSMWRAGERRLTLPQEVLGAAETAQQSALEDDPDVGRIQNYLDRRDGYMPGSINERVCTAEILEEVFDIPRKSPTKLQYVNRVRAIMRNDISGWVAVSGKQMTASYGIQRVYVPTKSAQMYPNG